MIKGHRDLFMCDAQSHRGVGTLSWNVIGPALDCNIMAPTLSQNVTAANIDVNLNRRISHHVLNGLQLKYFSKRFLII